MSERGFIAVDRDIFEHPLFAEEPFTEREAWLWLIAEAAWSPRRIRVGKAMMNVSRGQLAHSLRFMAAKWKWSEARVRRFLGRLKNDAMIDAVATQSATQITICNFDKFQGMRRTDNVESDAPDDAPATQNSTREQDYYSGHSARDRAGDRTPDAVEPAAIPPVRQLGPALNEAAGEAIANPAAAPGLLVLSEPMNWIRNGCDLEADILPAIRARSSRLRPGSVRSWAYFSEAVFQARDARLKPAPAPQETSHDRSARRPDLRKPAPHDAILAAVDRAFGLHDEAGTGNLDARPDDLGGTVLDFSPSHRDQGAFRLRA